MECDVRELLDEVGGPTLIIHGTEDEPVPYQMGVLLNQKLRNSTLVPFEAGCHMVWAQEPDRFVQEIESYVGIDHIYSVPRRR